MTPPALPLQEYEARGWPPAKYTPEFHQLDFHRMKGKVKYRALICGIGGGKTAAGVVEAYDWAITFPGCSGAIIAPDFRTWRNVIKPLCEIWWPEGTWKETVKNELVEVYAGGVVSNIFICSASNNEQVKRINGLNLTWFWIEEAARMNLGELAWRYAVGRLRETIAPFRGGWITGSPMGYNWLTDVFGIVTGLPPTAYTHGVTTRTVVDKKTGDETKFWVRGAQSDWNTHNPSDFVSSLLAVYGGDQRFLEQEIYGRILSQTDLIFYNWYPALHIVSHDVAMEIFEKCETRDGAVDWGFGLVAAMTWGGTTKGGWERGTKVTIGEVYGERLTTDILGWHANEQQKKYGTFRWFPDPENQESIRKWKTGCTHKGETFSIRGVVNPKFIRGKKYNQWKASVDQVLVNLAYVSGIDHPSYPEGNGLGGARWYVSERCTNLIKEYKKLLWAPKVIGGQRKREDAMGDRHAIDCERYRALGCRMIHKIQAKLVAGY